MSDTLVIGDATSIRKQIGKLEAQIVNFEADKKRDKQDRSFTLEVYDQKIESLKLEIAALQSQYDSLVKKEAKK